jgi:hypothetical protein
VADVFISYAHADGPFVDRLLRDLAEAGIASTYDKLALDIGDSIVEKVASIISQSIYVIAVVSRASVASTWVQRELAWAVAGELGGKQVRVLPALIDDCELPPVLGDKRFADFRNGYFPALRELVDAIRRTSENDPVEASSYERYLQTCERLEAAVDMRDRDAVYRVLDDAPRLVASLLANPRDIATAVPASDSMPPSPTFVCWTAATEYVCQFLTLGPLANGAVDEGQVRSEAEALARYALERHETVEAFLRACMLMPNGGALAQLLDATPEPQAPDHPPQERRRPQPVLDRMLLLAGRRDDHGDELIAFRRALKKELSIDLRSYDWLVERLGGKLYHRIGSMTTASSD